MPEDDEPKAALNTDRELWREREGDYYADSLHVTATGGIGINCGGLVIVLPVRTWHTLAAADAKIDWLVKQRRANHVPQPERSNSHEPGADLTPEGRQDLAAVIAEMRNYQQRKYSLTRCLTDWADRLALLLAEAHPQVEEKKEDTDTRVDDSQYPTTPLATAAENKLGPTMIRAEALARLAHAGQTEESTGDDYIHHVERVVSLVDGDEAKAVAWLHDVVEDAPSIFGTNPQDLLKAVGFSAVVIDAVLRLTRGYYVRSIAPYADYVASIIESGNPLAVAVKIADLRDHLRPNCPARLRQKYEVALAVLTSGGNQPLSGLRGDPGAPRTVNGEARDEDSAQRGDVPETTTNNPTSWIAWKRRAFAAETALREVVTNGDWRGGVEWVISTAVYEMAADALAALPEKDVVAKQGDSHRD